MPVVRCEECWCVSDSGTGWFGFVDEEREGGESPLILTYCPPCAARRFDARPRERGYV